MSLDLIMSIFCENSFNSYHSFDMSTESARIVNTFLKASLSLNSSKLSLFLKFYFKKFLIFFIAKSGKHIKMMIDLFHKRYLK
jgi:hypothetical protein